MDDLIMEDHQVTEQAQAMEVNNQAKIIAKVDSLAMKIKMKIIDPVDRIIKIKIPLTIEILVMDSRLSHRPKTISYNRHQFNNQASKTLK